MEHCDQCLAQDYGICVNADCPCHTDTNVCPTCGMENCKRYLGLLEDYDVK